MGLLNSHLDDAACASVWTERATSGTAQAGRTAEAHLRDCAECRTRFTAFSAWLDGLRTDAIAEAEDALGADRLTAQHAQIMRRLEAMEQPSRVIAFPRFTQPTAVRPHDGRRWIAGAAAAGLVVGLGLGQMLDFGASMRAIPAVGSTQQVARGGFDPSMVGLQPVASVSDEAYLYEYEEYEPDILPSTARVPESLQYLNAITPSARDYESR